MRDPFQLPERALFKIPVLAWIDAIVFSDSKWMRAMTNEMKRLKPLSKRDKVQYAHQLRIWVQNHPPQDRRNSITKL